MELTVGDIFPDHRTYPYIEFDSYFIASTNFSTVVAGDKDDITRLYIIRSDPTGVDLRRDFLRITCSLFNWVQCHGQWR
jgi:hypothetical protein